MEIEFIKTKLNNKKYGDRFCIEMINKKNNKEIGHYFVNGNLLYNVYINPKYRGYGYGNLLVKHSVENFNKLYLSVEKDNIAAIKAYIKNGFKEFKKKKYYIYMTIDEQYL